MENKILGSTKCVVETSKHVQINQEAIERFCTAFDHEHIKHWLDEAPFDIKTLDTEDRLNFMLVFNAISFSYWGEPKWTIEYKGKEYDGSWAMIACIAKAKEVGRSILDANYLARLSREEFAKILDGNIEIPLLDERLAILNDVGQVLLEKYNGEFKNLITEAKGAALSLVDLIVQNFKGFADQTIYEDKDVYFYKRAQLLVADIYQAFDGFDIGNLRGVEYITACADYKLPMMLRKMNILEYTEELADKIDNYKELLSGNAEEVEIRANTIWAVEHIKDMLRTSMPNVTSIHVNDHLWLISQEKFADDKPYHRTRTTAY